MENNTINVIITEIYLLDTKNLGISRSCETIKTYLFGYKGIIFLAFNKIFTTHIVFLPQNNTFRHNLGDGTKLQSIFATSLFLNNFKKVVICSPHINT